MILSLLGKSPLIDPTSWIAKNSVVTGDVVIDEESSVFFYSVIRGDVNHIRIGKRTNIQDGCIVHGSTGKQETIIGNDVTVGHRAIIHGCIIDDQSLIGMGAIIQDDVRVESHVLVAAGSVVLQSKILKSGHLYAGVPAKMIRALDTSEIEEIILNSSKRYVSAGRSYMQAGV